MDSATIDRVAEWLPSARSVVALTGAGISTESGISDFCGPQGLWTKNPGVDGLHHAAGSTADIIVEIHVTVREVECVSCGERAPMEHALERVRAGEDDPPCRSCGGILKSAAIFFGQGLVEHDMRRAEIAAQQCDLLLALGTTISVYPIAGVVPVAKRAGARVVIVNAEPIEMDELADAILTGSIGIILPRIVAAM
jgi:NAD-dependent deacetylase